MSRVQTGRGARPFRYAAAFGAWAVSLCVLAAILSAALASSRRGAAAASRCRASGTKTICTINEPDVGSPLTEYRDITFNANDVVTIRAGGCVQTGGAGKTWKRYVDPSGPNSDQFYHGLIWIPGAMAGPERVQALDGQQVKVQSCAVLNQNNLFLRLGYEDDNFSDNGYQDHDDGTEDQCSGSVNAFVELEIEPNGVWKPDPPAPLDLERPESCDNIDPNFLPLNPRWGWQRTNPPELPDPVLRCSSRPDLFEDPGCSKQHPSFDLPSGSNATACGLGPTASNPFDKIAGHVNYFPAVYTGSIFWEEHSGGLFGDDDYNFSLVPDGKAGLTTANSDRVGIEFDSDETIDYFDTPWWDKFHHAVDTAPGLAKSMASERHAVVAGLIGLDCQHDCKSEIHPVYAMAVHVERNVLSQSPFSVEDVWAVFVRNFGNEGYCSSQIHSLYLLDGTFTFKLNGPDNQPGNASCEVLPATVFRANNPKSRWYVDNVVTGHSVRLSFSLPEQHPWWTTTRINGELHLKWTWPATTAVAASPRGGRATAAAARPVQEETVEHRLASLSSRLTPEQLDYYYQNTRTPKVADGFEVTRAPDASALKADAGSPASGGRGGAGLGASNPGLRDQEKEARDRKKYVVGAKLLRTAGRGAPVRKAARRSAGSRRRR